MERREADEHNAKYGITGWSANGILSPRDPALPIVAPVFYQPPKGAILLQAKLQQPSYYTVQFELALQANQFIVSVGTKGIAEIIWSVKGNSIRRVISVYSGTVISGTGEHVSVTLLDDSEPGLAPVANYPATINLALGTRPSTPQPPTLYSREVIGGTYPPYTLAAAGVLSIAVPFNVGANQIFLQVRQSAASTAVLPNDIVVEQSAGGTIMAVYNLEYCNGWIPLAPGTTSVLVRNRSAVNYQVVPVWGIEG